MEVKLRVPCHLCDSQNVVAIPDDEYKAWEDGMLIQDAMPSVSKADRELLVSGTCGECWDSIFAEVDETA